MKIIVFLILLAYVWTWNKYYMQEREAGQKASFKNYIQYIKTEYFGNK